jgi:hypothetical protein
VEALQKQKETENRRDPEAWGEKPTRLPKRVD